MDWKDENSYIIKMNMFVNSQIIRLERLNVFFNWEILQESRHLDLSKFDCPKEAIINRTNTFLSSEFIRQNSNITMKFDELLNNTSFLISFTEFMEKEFSQENIIFWKRCNEYLKDKDQFKLNKIINDHLISGSILEVNLPHNIRDKVLSEKSVESINMAKRNIQDLMEGDSFQRYRMQPEFKNIEFNSIVGSWKDVKIDDFSPDMLLFNTLTDLEKFNYLYTNNHINFGFVQSIMRWQFCDKQKMKSQLMRWCIISVITEFIVIALFYLNIISSTTNLSIIVASTFLIFVLLCIGLYRIHLHYLLVNNLIECF